jgi:phosphorylcholine metabolism protein LicD
MQDKKNLAVENLRDFKCILDCLNIVFWLDGGTLLGAYRDGDFPPGDEDDIDLGAWFNYAVFAGEIIEQAERAGFTLYLQWKHQMVFKRYGCKIDLFFHNKMGRDAWHFLYKRLSEEDDMNDKTNFKYKETTANGMKWGCIPAVVPAHFFEQLHVIDFYGMTFNRPRDIEKYFVLKYGEYWQTPITREEYFARGGCYDPSVNKVLKPHYEIS